MKRAWLVVALAACAKQHAPPPAEEVKPVTLIGCEVAWRPTADAIEIDTTPAPPPRPVPGPPAAGDGGLVIEIQGAKVAGGLDASTVRKALAKGHDAMEHCYASRLASRPGLAGHIDLDFTVGPDGKVVSPSSAGLDRALGQCLVRVVNTLAFKAPRGGGAKIRVTVVLHPAGGGTEEPVDEEPAVVEPPPPPDSVLATLAWADDGADAGLASWASERAAPSVDAIDFSACALGGTGTVEARLGVDREGHVIDAEVGGVGSEAVEACVKGLLAGATIAPPPTAAALRCELAVGAPGHARDTMRNGEPVIDVGTDVRIRGTAYDLAALGDQLRKLQSDGAVTIHVRVGGEANVTFLGAVLSVLDARKDPYVVGVVDGAVGAARISDRVKRGAGRPRATVGVRPRVEITGGKLVATVPGRGVVATGALGDPAAGRAVLAEVASCGECERVVEVAAAPGTEARWLAEVAAWSADAGLPRLVLVTL